MNKIKLTCVALLAAFGVSLLLLTNLFTPIVSSFSGGPPPGFSGAPGEGVCSDCHISKGGSGQFTIIPPATYVPGQTYQVTVRHQTPDPTRQRWGFELTSLTTDLAAAGTFANTSGF